VLNPERIFFLFWSSCHVGSENTFTACIYLAGIDSNISHGMSSHRPDLRAVWTT